MAVQKIIRRENILANVQAMGRVLEKELRGQLSGLPFVADVRGRGLFWAVEFLDDPKEKRPFLPELGFSDKIVDAARELGLNVLGNLGKTGVYDVELVILSPPYIVNDTEIREIVRLLRTAVIEVGERFLAKKAEPPPARCVLPAAEEYVGEARAVL